MTLAINERGEPLQELSEFTATTYHEFSISTVMRIIKLKLFPVSVRLHSGYGNLFLPSFHHFLQYILFKNVVHSLEPGETPSYSASHQAPTYAQRS